MKHIVSTVVTSDIDAQMMAQHLLDESLGLAEEDVATILPNPAMRVDDLVQITRESAMLSAVNIVIDQVSMPLVATRAGQAISRRRALAP